MADLRLEGLTCEYRMNLLGSDVKRPRFSWKIVSERRGTLIKAYQIQMVECDYQSKIPSNTHEVDFGTPLWDTGVVESDKSIHVVYTGPALKSRTRYVYRVKVWDDDGHGSAWSCAWWETRCSTPLNGPRVDYPRS